MSNNGLEMQVSDHLPYKFIHNLCITEITDSGYLIARE